MTIEVPDYHRLYVECRALLEKLADNSLHDYCAISRDYAPPYAECDCGLAEAEKFLKENPCHPIANQKSGNYGG